MFKNVLLCLVLFCLAGCGGARFAPYHIETFRNQDGESKYGEAKYEVANGVPIWTFGEPDRAYVVIDEYIDTRGSALINYVGIYSDVAAKVKEAGGDAAFRYSQMFKAAGPTVTTTTMHIGKGYSYPTTSTSTPKNRVSRYKIIKFKDTQGGGL